MSAGLTWLNRSLALMMLIKNLRRHSLPPLRRISSRDSKLQDEVGRWSSDRDVTHEVKLVRLHLKARLLAVITFSCSEVLIRLLVKRPGISANGIPNLSTSVVVPGGYHVQSLSQRFQNPYRKIKQQSRVQHLFYYINQSTSLRHMPGTSPSGLNQT
jgi:hypothetical protein